MTAPAEVILLDPERMRAARRSPVARHRRERAFQWFCIVIATLCVVLLGVIIAGILFAGVGSLSRNFLTAPPGPDASVAGFYPAIMGSVWLLFLVAIITLPLGVAAAIILEEFKPKRRAFRMAHGFIETNISNLAGVPSVVYGIVGLTAFVSMFGLFGAGNPPAVELGARHYDQFYNEADRVILVPVPSQDAPETAPSSTLAALDAEKRPIRINVIGPEAPWPDDPALAARTLRATDYGGRISERTAFYFRVPFGRGLLAGALTLSLVILPVVIITSQEALRAVPGSLRHAALGLGATRRRVVFRVTLPAAMPGIMTGAILAMSRAIGEAAPLLMIAGIVFISFAPGNLMDDFTAMPLQIYNWAQRPQEEFHDLAAAGIVVLLAVLLVFNGAAIVIRQRFQRRQS